jgi:hypothetical protein
MARTFDRCRSSSANQAGEAAGRSAAGIVFNEHTDRTAPRSLGTPAGLDLVIVSAADGALRVRAVSGLDQGQELCEAAHRSPPSPVHHGIG